MPAPDIIHQLVQRFDDNRASYRSGAYNETQLRREFLDPFFEALGWDMLNRQGYAEAYKDVVHEDAIKVGGGTRAPDYAFRIGGTRKFFVEAKKPAVNIKEEISPAFQLRRYAWSARLPLSILTDFEEFAVYDCRGKPDRRDKVSTGRLWMLNYPDYLDKWEEIAAIFSHEAVLKGSFDRYAEASKGKHGTAEVDDAFLAEIERWRELLARNIALRNPTLSQRELNYAVQMTIDRIIFLRIAEDRGIEPYGTLQGLVNGAEIYARLGYHFRKADERYNSGLFHFRDEAQTLKVSKTFRVSVPDEVDSLTLNLAIDDKPLRDILGGLYYPDSPYEFSMIPADILGQVYEQFLGKVIRLTAGHHAVVEDKPEVKKAGGVFYTPTYIVDYIVKHTLGVKLEGKTPSDYLPSPARRGAGGDVSGKKSAGGQVLRILDPACGSGSFLLGAYQYLLDWYRDGYIADDPEKWAKGSKPRLVQVSLSPPFREGSGVGWKLTTSERKRILLDHIFGVDIDPQAVEVTKLSLLLKVLEGENEGSLARQLSFWQERALPDLGRNIQCGNSLIGPDFYQGMQPSFLELEEQYRINAFDWEKAYPQVFKDGGFDVVIGNPPYVRQEGLGKDKEYYQTHYKSYVQTADLYVNFLEKSLSLINQQGTVGMIVSNKWLRAAYGLPLRKLLQENATFTKIIDLAGLPVFENATVRTIIAIFTRITKVSHNFLYLAPPSKDEFRKILTGDDLHRLTSDKGVYLLQDSLRVSGWNFLESDTQRVVDKLSRNTQAITSYLGKKIYRGIITGLNEAFVIDEFAREKLIYADPKSAEIIKPMLAGRDVRRYSINYRSKYLIWTYIGVPINRYPAIFNHLKNYQAELQKRWDQGEHWWELRACDYYGRFSEPKIIYPDIATSCRFYLDEDGYFSSNTTYFLPASDKYLLGILNSKLGQFYFNQVCAGLEGGGTTYLRFFGQYMENFPVKPINSSNPTDVQHYDLMVALVERMLSLHQQLAAANTPVEKTMLQRQIDATDGEIDRLVYELYGLTEEEIKIVEGN